MTTLIDITGQKFGRLTVIRRCGTAKNGNALWLCQCRCGNQTKADSYALRHGRARSCECLTRESRSQLIRRNPKTAASMGRLSNLKIHDHHTDLPSKIMSKRNKSGVIGVSWDSNTQKWVATFFYKGRYLLHKPFQHFEDAVLARQAMESRYLNNKV